MRLSVKKWNQNIFGSLSRLHSVFLEKKRQRHLNSLIKRGLRFGKNVEIIADFFFDPSHCFLISIGDNCTICPNVRLIAHDASTKRLIGYTKIGKIAIGDNCFIGDSVVVLPNVKIGNNSIVGGGSVVAKDIPTNAVAAGNPAEVIFTIDEYYNKLIKVIESKTLFDERYFIKNLDKKKRDEILESIKDTIGFIV